MSKKTKDSVNEYFSHDYHARNDPKLQKLQAKMGHEGKGIYWDIIELLYEQGGKLKISEIETYAFSIRCDENAFKNVISDFDLFTKIDDEFWSESVLRRLAIRSGKSASASKSARKRWGKVDAIALQPHSERTANALQTQSERNAIKEKKRKEKNIKEYEIKEKEMIQNPFGDGFQKKWDEWKEYRKQCKKPILPLSEQKAINELHKLAGGSETIAAEIIDTSIANGWQGLFEKKSKTQTGRAESPTQTDDITRIIDEFNALTQSQYDKTDDAIRGYLAGRLMDGCQLQDMLDVIALKAVQWGSGDERKFLKFQTLFKPQNYPGYVQEVRDAKAGKIKVLNPNESRYDRIQRKIDAALGRTQPS